MTAPSPPLRSYAAELESALARIEALEVLMRSPQLGGSSIDGGVLQARSSDGTRIETWGMQPDGTVGTKSLSKVPPPVPSAPDVTPFAAGLSIGWGGQLVGNMPSDFRDVRVHVSIVPDFIVGESNYVGSLLREGSIPVAPLPYVTHYVKLVAVNKAGAASEASLQSSGTPQQVVADAVLDGIITETSLASAAVTKAKLAAGSVTQTAVAPNSIGTPQLIARSVQAEQMAANSVQAGTVAADVITGREIKALSLTGDLLAANTIDAGHVKAGAITAQHLETDLALATRLIAGDPRGTRVELSGSGMVVIRKDGETTFSVDSATGDVVSMGQYYTSRFGERIAMNAFGVSEPTIRAYPRRGNRYADLRSFTRTVGSTDLANWEFRLPYLAPNGGNFELCLYGSNFAAIESTRLRYGLRTNSSGIAQPSLEATGQDCGLVWFDGCLYVTNIGNTARRDIQARTVFAESYLRFPGQDAQMKGFASTIRAVNSADTTEVNFWCRTLVQTASERRLKDHDHNLTGALDAVRRWAPAVWTWKDARINDTDRHVGLYVDEIADTAPDAIIDRGDGTRTYDDRAVLAYLAAAIQDLAAENDALRDQVDELTARLNPDGAAA